MASEPRGATDDERIQAVLKWMEWRSDCRQDAADLLAAIDAASPRSESEGYPGIALDYEKMRDALVDIGGFKGEGPSTTDWQSIVRTLGEIARGAVPAETSRSATARKPKECEQGCPPRQVCDYCQNVNAAPGKGDGRYSSPDQSIDSPARPAGNAPVAAPLSQSDKNCGIAKDDSGREYVTNIHDAAARIRQLEAHLAREKECWEASERRAIKAEASLSSVVANEGETPRTDALLLDINEGRTYGSEGPLCELARQLERELAEMIEGWAAQSTRAERAEARLSATVTPEHLAFYKREELRYAVLRRWMVDEDYCIKGMPQAGTREDVDRLCDAEIAKAEAKRGGYVQPSSIAEDGYAPGYKCCGFWSPCRMPDCVPEKQGGDIPRGVR